MTQLEMIQDYYGKVLSSKDDLKTTACCAAETIPTYLKGLVSQVHRDVSSRFYGCGVPIPPNLDGKVVLDLGSGTGRDCFVLAALTGDQGEVIGIDMTDEQIAVAQKYEAYHREAMNLKGKLSFRQGFIEDLAASGINDSTVDVVVSNCVINLSPDKEAVFREIFRVLKPGGELYFSDVFCDRRLPQEMQEDKVLLGECLGGAMYVEDLRRVLVKNGVKDYRIVGSSQLDITNDDVVAKTGNARLYSKTVRAFKMDLEDRCEDYGQVAIYKGSLPYFKHGFLLDDHHYFPVGKPIPVCSNTADMLTQSRFMQHFEIVGNTEHHYGLFDCNNPVTSEVITTNGCC